MSEYHKHAAPWDYEPEFAKHMCAMTAEDLHNKADIALELAIRDRRIAELERKVTEALGFSYAYCATWEASGRRVGELEAPKILDAWKKSGGMT